MSLPLSTIGSSSTKNSIIEILSREWPLTAKKIYGKLKRQYKLSLTYQATHKALKELTENSILEKKKEGYVINKEWIKSLGSFSEKLLSDLEALHAKREIKTFHKISFENHREFIKFHLDFIDKVMKEDKKLNVVIHCRHVPYPHVLTNEEIKKLRLMRNMKCLILSKKDTILDRWCAKQWKKMGVNVKLGAEIGVDMKIILNDYIMDIYNTKEVISMWDKIHSVKSVNDFDATSMSESILNTKLKIVVTVYKDKELASLLKKA
ncbi:hypothetical protein J4221_00130 [Candidatus Pacearchaeota archaeon]|nr:hypothetical protein [Candidatus Pacearchaeota archaeon]